MSKAEILAFDLGNLGVPGVSANGEVLEIDPEGVEFILSNISFHSTGPFLNSRTPNSSLRCSNAAEAKFLEHARSKGWRVYRRGWPDYLVLNKALRPFTVEVKKNSSQRVSGFQEMFARVFNFFGLPAFRWDPENGLKRLR